MNEVHELEPADLSRVIEMAWEDRTPFDAIRQSYSLSEPEVILLMRKTLKAGSFRLWRKRVNGRATKHATRASPDATRQYCPTQYKPKSKK